MIWNLMFPGEIELEVRVKKASDNRSGACKNN